MSKERSKSLAELISRPQSGLGKLAAAARRQTALSDYLRAGLGLQLGAGVAHCNIRDDGTAVVLATSPEWAARLRFEAPRILELCREHGSNATAVKVRVSG